MAVADFFQMKLLWDSLSTFQEDSISIFIYTQLDLEN